MATVAEAQYDQQRSKPTTFHHNEIADLEIAGKLAAFLP